MRKKGGENIMKRSIILSLVVATLVASSCFGIEVLSTGTTIGTSKCAIEGFYSSTSFQLANTSIIQYGPRVVYGLTDDMDLTGKLGLGTAAGLNSSTIGAGIKYALVKDTSDNAVNISGLVNFETVSANSYTMSNTSFGFVVSRDLKNSIILYGLANVILTSAKVTGVPSSSGTGLQIGGGIRGQINAQTSLMGEISLYNVDSNSYATVAFGMQYMIL
jgi:hypothetical protein